MTSPIPDELPLLQIGFGRPDEAVKRLREEVRKLSPESLEEKS